MPPLLEASTPKSAGNTRASWEKFVFLVGLSATTTTIGLPIGPIRTEPQTRAFLLDVMREVVSVARANDVDLPQDYAEQRLEFRRFRLAGDDLFNGPRPRPRKPIRSRVAVRRSHRLGPLGWNRYSPEPSRQRHPRPPRWRARSYLRGIHDAFWTAASTFISLKITH